MVRQFKKLIYDKIAPKIVEYYHNNNCPWIWLGTSNFRSLDFKWFPMDFRPWVWHARLKLLKPKSYMKSVLFLHISTCGYAFLGTEFLVSNTMKKYLRIYNTYYSCGSTKPSIWFSLIIIFIFVKPLLVVKHKRFYFHKNPAMFTDPFRHKATLILLMKRQAVKKITVKLVNEQTCLWNEDPLEEVTLY